MEDQNPQVPPIREGLAQTHTHHPVGFNYLSRNITPSVTDNTTQWNTPGNITWGTVTPHMFSVTTLNAMTQMDMEDMVKFSICYVLLF